MFHDITFSEFLSTEHLKEIVRLSINEPLFHSPPVFPVCALIAIEWFKVFTSTKNLFFVNLQRNKGESRQSDTNPPNIKGFSLRIHSCTTLKKKKLVTTKTLSSESPGCRR